MGLVINLRRIWKPKLFPNFSFKKRSDYCQVANMTTPADTDDRWQGQALIGHIYACSLISVHDKLSDLNVYCCDLCVLVREVRLTQT